MVQGRLAAISAHWSTLISGAHGKEMPTPGFSRRSTAMHQSGGVTFAISAMERVIEERARGEAAHAEEIRASLRDRVGTDIRSVKPGSDAARKLKAALISDGLWSQYLEVAIGPDAEVFTKAPVLSSVGWGDWIGVRSDSAWNNPEPEVVIVCDRKGRALGATLGNDVNLRDIEGRSALLLARRRITTLLVRLAPLSACSTRLSRWTMRAKPWWSLRFRARTISTLKARAP